MFVSLLVVIVGIFGYTGVFVVDGLSFVRFLITFSLLNMFVSWGRSNARKSRFGVCVAGCQQHSLCLMVSCGLGYSWSCQYLSL